MVMIKSLLKPVIVYAPIYNSWTGGGRKTRSSFKASSVTQFIAGDLVLSITKCTKFLKRGLISGQVY